MRLAAEPGYETPPLPAVCVVHEGLPYAEIARITEVPVGTVKSRIFRARQALQKRLYDYAVEMGYIGTREVRP